MAKSKVSKGQVFAFLRVSTGEQGKPGSHGLDNQRRLIDSYVKRHDLPEPIYISDIGISAFSFQNLEFGLLGEKLAELTRKPIKGSRPKLLFAFASRLTRANPITVMTRIQKYVMDHGIDFVFCDCNIELTKSDNTMQFTVNYFIAMTQLMAAHKESADKSKSTKQNWQAEREALMADADSPATGKNVSINNRFPWWFRLDKKSKPIGLTKRNEPKYRLIVDKEMAKVVRLVFRMFLNGKSINAITRHLNDNKIVRPSIARTLSNGKKSTGLWNSSSVRYILDHESLIGRKTHRQANPDSKENGSTTAVQGGELVIINTAYPKIIALKEWRAVQELLSTNKGGRNSTDREANVFRGVLRDGYDDYMLKRQWNGRKRLPYYRTQYDHVHDRKHRITNVSGTKLKFAFFKSYSLLMHNHELATRWNKLNDESAIVAEKELDEKKMKLETTKQNIEKFDEAAVTIGSDYINRNKHRREKWIKEESELIEKIAKAENQTENYHNEEILKLFDSLANGAKDNTKIEKMSAFLKSTGHEIKLFPNGIRFNKPKILEKFKAIDPEMGKIKNWDNFEEVHFKENPFRSLNEYMFLNYWYGKIDPKEMSENPRKYFEEFFSIETKKEKNISKIKIERPITKGTSFFVCWLPNNRFFACGFDTKGDTKNCIKWMVFDYFFNSHNFIEENNKTLITSHRTTDNTVSFANKKMLDVAYDQAMKHAVDLQKFILNNVGGGDDALLDDTFQQWKKDEEFLLKDAPAEFLHFWLKCLICNDHSYYR
jgi:DNA invertase Pin-like site-specific DNA recombinase